MEVKKIGYTKIPPSFLTYYKLKTKYVEKSLSLCPKCKKGPLEFDESDRILSVKCVTQKCENNMSIVVHTYLSYDTLYDKKKKEYEENVNQIVKEKFDIMFNYKKPTDIKKMKNAYIDSKTKLNELQQHYYDKLSARLSIDATLETQRKELIKELKKGKGEKSIQEDLNVVLNEIRRNTYVNIGDHVLPISDFDQEIMV
jgi:ribosomal protein S27AE